MCYRCDREGHRVRNCRDRSPPTPPNRPVELNRLDPRDPRSRDPRRSDPRDSRSSDPSDPRRSDQSGRSSDSAVSTHSQNSVDSVASNPSINELTRRISNDLTREGYSSNRLEAWLQSLHPSTYQKHPRDWPRQVLAAYDDYKRQGDRLAAAHQAYDRARAQFGRPANYTAEQHIQLADLAVKWGAASVQYANTKMAIMLQFWLIGNFLGPPKHEMNFSSPIAAPTDYQ